MIRSSGQMFSGSLMDYALPRAADLPDLNITLTGVPTNANPLGVKGAGQAGAIAAPQTIISAVLDALAPFGVTHIDMPATPRARLARDPCSPAADRQSHDQATPNCRRGVPGSAGRARHRASVLQSRHRFRADRRGVRPRRPQQSARCRDRWSCRMKTPRVGMAHGYTMVTGKPQAVMLHTNVGTANAINMLIDASRDRIPMLLTSGPHAFHRGGR